jgi:hypothetical protein
MRRWTAEELARERLELSAFEGLPEERVPFGVHVRLVDYLVQRYLPANDRRTEAEWLAARARIIDRMRCAAAGGAFEPPAISPHVAPGDPVFDAFVEELGAERHRRRERGRLGNGG